MMSVLEYAEDVNKSVSEILKKCGELGIDATDEEYMLNEEEITELDNTINTEIDEEEIEETSFENSEVFATEGGLDKKVS